MKNLLFLFVAAVVNICAFAQASLEEIAATPGKAGGVYYAYPEPEILQTPAPNGYKPFYISHYGRHGSRYLISDNDYTAPRDILRRAADADALTPLAEISSPDLIPCGLRLKGAVANFHRSACVSTEALLTACTPHSRRFSMQQVAIQPVPQS